MKWELFSGIGSLRRDLSREIRVASVEQTFPKIGNGDITYGALDKTVKMVSSIDGSVKSTLVGQTTYVTSIQ